MKSKLNILKKAVVDNLEKLETIRRDCLDTGMEDVGSELYNEIYELTADAKASENIEELEQIIDQAQVLEKKVDRWLSVQGLSSVGLSWPSDLG
ncbi:MAG: hypothetical protein HZB76_01780 [Chlamydiae bacterium]|nr:hypothetical protein [Chlamydiota bacterium]